MVEKLGIQQNYLAHVSQSCKGDPEIKSVVKCLLGEAQNMRNVEENIETNLFQLFL